MFDSAIADDMSDLDPRDIEALETQYQAELEAIEQAEYDAKLAEEEDEQD